MSLLINIIHYSVEIYIWIIIAQVAISWLVVFDVINASNQQAQNLIALLKKATDPVYKRLKKFIPPIGGIDLTPIVVIIGLSILRQIVISALI